MIIQKPYRVGECVRVKHVHGGYRLPDGLPEGAVVRVLAFHTGYRDVEYQGRTYHIAMACIDSGYTSRPVAGVEERRQNAPSARHSSALF